jgi:hypothetical protein
MISKVPSVAEAWLWATALVLGTITIHVVGITFIARALRRFWSDDVDSALTFFDSVLGGIAVVVVLAFGLAVLHGIESLVWASVYIKVGAFTSMTDATLYSIGSMTTRGSSGFHLPPGWALMGAVEAGDGMLLFGISTAFLFTVMLRLGRLIMRHPQP